MRLVVAEDGPAVVPLDLPATLSWETLASLRSQRNCCARSNSSGCDQQGLPVKSHVKPVRNLVGERLWSSLNWSLRDLVLRARWSPWWTPKRRYY